MLAFSVWFAGVFFCFEVIGFFGEINFSPTVSKVFDWIFFLRFAVTFNTNFWVIFFAKLFRNFEN